MTSIDRRALLAGSMAAFAAGPTFAAASKARVQGPGVYRYKLGDYQLTAIDDGTWFVKLDKDFVRNAGTAAVNRALAASFLPPNVLPVSFTVLLVNTGAKLVMIDAGTGGQIADTAGVMLANLAVADIEPRAVETIVISHFHPDHINAIKTKDGEKVFPNAEILVPEPEMDVLDERGARPGPAPGRRCLCWAVRKCSCPRLAPPTAPRRSSG